jgi:hypothetical protein
MANAFLKVGSVSGPPTFTTVTVAPCFLETKSHVLNRIRHLNYILYAIGIEFWITIGKINFEVVSGTWLMQTNIFIGLFFF